jgi:hypothetical protein
MLSPNLNQCLVILVNGIQELSHVSVCIILYKACFIAALDVNTNGVKNYSNY